jgi:hypothetical protein
VIRLNVCLAKSTAASLCGKLAAFEEQREELRSCIVRAGEVWARIAMLRELCMAHPLNGETGMKMLSTSR